MAPLTPQKIVAGYIPVIHFGYMQLLGRYPEHTVGLFDASITEATDYLRKDIRTLPIDVVKTVLESQGREVIIISKQDIAGLLGQPDTNVIFFDDDLSRSLLDELDGQLQAKIDFESPFLRWDRRSSDTNTEVTADEIVAEEQLDGTIVASLYDEAQRSTDWWRHVGAGTFHEGEFITTHNTAMPHEHITGFESDPRITQSRGVNIDKSLFIHAEALLIANFARQGIALEGKDIYVTTFPCSNCARLIAASGFKACYFIEGYANLDGQRILQEAGVKLVKIDISQQDSTAPSRLRPYPDKKNKAA